MKKIRVAVIGLGNFGARHARTLAALPEADLVGLVDQQAGRAASLARELGVSCFSENLAALCEQTSVDAVVIATRTDTHLPLARQAAELGIHALIEKPAGSSEEIARFLDRKPAKTAVMVNHICLFHSLVAPLITRVRREGFRALHFVRHRPVAVAKIHREEHPIRLTMIHDFYVAAQMAAGEEPVAWRGEESLGENGQADMAWATLRWKDGRIATFHSHWTLPESAPSDGWDFTEVFGSGFYAKVKTNPAPWREFEACATWPVALEISEILGRPAGMLAEVLRSFLAACQGEPVPAGCRLQDALQAAHWIEKLLPPAGSNKL